MTPTADRIELEHLKAGVDLLALVRDSGLEPKKKGKNWLCRCPFHEGDCDPSLSIQGQLWNCFGCEAGGDALTWLQLKEKLSFAEAVARLRDLVEPGSERPQPTHQAQDEAKQLPGGFKRQELLARVAELYHKRFAENLDGQEYLKGRGLGSPELWKAFQVGFCDGSLLATLPSDGPILDALQAIGVLTADGKEHFRGCVVVPLSHPDLGVVGLYGRRIRADAKNRHLYLPGPHQGVLNWQALRSSSSVYLVESVLDVFSCWMAGERQATCVFSTQTLPGPLTELLKRYSVKEVVLAFDGDRAGMECTQKLTAALPELGLQVASVRLPEGEDPNSLLLTQGSNGLQKRLRQRDQNEPEKTPPHCEKTRDGLVLEMDGVRYEMQILPPFSSRLRVSLRGMRGEHFLQDRLDLYLHRDRLKLAKQLGSQLQLARLDAERHHSEIFRLCEEWVRERRQRDKPAEETEAQKMELTATQREQALHFLRHPQLVGSILSDMEQLGFVGEENAKLLAYLIGVSRKLPKPLSGIILSQSGCGKSTLTDLVEQLTPPEEVLFFTRITAQALTYLAEGTLKGKLLIVEERTGAEAAEYSIRVLQSRQKLTQAVPLKDPATGKISTQIITVEGPVAYLETTTDPKINHENATRCFEITLDETVEQTERIHQVQRARRMPARENLHRVADEVRERHHNAQRLLEPVLVFIPFADCLTFPNRKLRNRRDHERFLCLIEASAFLHQHQRVRGETDDGDGYVLASPDDYELAYALAQEVLATTLHELSRGAKDVWQQARDWLLGIAGSSFPERLFTRRELRQVTGTEDHQLRSALNELVEMEYMEVASGTTGRAYQYRLLIARDEDVPTFLLPPAQLRAEFEKPREPRETLRAR